MSSLKSNQVHSEDGKRDSEVGELDARHGFISYETERVNITFLLSNNCFAPHVMSPGMKAAPMSYLSQEKWTLCC